VVKVLSRIALFFTLFCLLFASADVEAADESVQTSLSRQDVSPHLQPAADQQNISIAGLKVAVWQTALAKQPMPLIIFSHGFHGHNTQTRFLAMALAKAGYIVLAPEHADASVLGNTAPPEIPFRQANDWSETTYKKRCLDIQNLLAALHKDKHWSDLINWSQVGLCGHSLGGYTVLGLAGAWSSWQIPDVKAVLALSPYCEPFIVHDTLGGIKIPVMYQGGTRDFGITPSIKKNDGAFSKTGSPAYFIEFDKMGHLGWTGLNQNADQRELIDFYSIAFFDKYLRGDKSAKLEEKKDGVTALISK
jgi:predicted dienelactone hydrolase